MWYAFLFIFFLSMIIINMIPNHLKPPFLWRTRTNMQAAHRMERKNHCPWTFVNVLEMRYPPIRWKFWKEKGGGRKREAVYLSGSSQLILEQWNLPHVYIHGHSLFCLTYLYIFNLNTKRINFLSFTCHNPPAGKCKSPIQYRRMSCRFVLLTPSCYWYLYRNPNRRNFCQW